MILNRNLIKFISVVIFFGGISDTFAQYNDAQLWENFSISKKLTRNSNLHFNHEGRFTNNMSLFYYLYGDIGITRSINKYFKIELDYVLVWKQTNTRESWRHQWYTALIFKHKLFKRLEFGDRFMYQQQYQDFYSSDAGRYPQDYLRNKLMLFYNFKTYPYYKFSPYISTETYYHLDNNDKYGPQFDRNRYFAGVFYNFNKKNALELYYMIEKHFNINNPPTNYVCGIGYEINL
jgi:hypothetical protein